MLRILYSCVILILAPVLEASTGFSAVDLAESLEIHPVSSDPSKNVRFNWDSRKPLNWSDFRGTPNRQSKFAASANTGMSHSYAISPDGVLIKNASKVQAHFYPYLSWYVPKLINETTLGHEQTHFDISELHARKLRKTIAEFRFTSRSKQEIQKIYTRIEIDRKTMQKQFDAETKHSVDRKREQEWEAFIKKELQKYARWAV